MQKDEVILNISTKEKSNREDPNRKFQINNGEAPQCSCSIEECTNMESSLPQNHLEHATSASVHKAKANHGTCTKDMVEP